MSTHESVNVQQSQDFPLQEDGEDEVDSPMPSVRQDPGKKTWDNKTTGGDTSKQEKVLQQSKRILTKVVLQDSKGLMDPNTQIFLEQEGAGYLGMKEHQIKQFVKDVSNIEGKSNLTNAIRGADLDQVLHADTMTKLQRIVFKEGCHNWGQVLILLCAFVEISKRLMKDRPVKSYMDVVTKHLQEALRVQPAQWIIDQGGWESYTSPDTPPNIRIIVELFLDNGEPFLVLVNDLPGKSGGNLSEKLVQEVLAGFKKGYTAPQVFVIHGSSDPGNEIKSYAKFKHAVFVVFITPNSLKNKISNWYSDCLGSGDGENAKKNIVIPVEIFGLKSKDIPPIFKSFNLIKAFPKSTWKASDVRDFVGILKGQYDSLLRNRAAEDLAVNKEDQLDIKVAVLLKNTKISDHDQNEIITSIKAHTKFVLEDPWTTLRQHLLHMYHIRNIRVVDVLNTDHLILEILTLQTADVEKLITNYYSNLLHPIFPDHIKMPEITDKFSFSVSFDTDKAKELVKRLKKDNKPAVNCRAQVLGGVIKAMIEDEKKHDLYDIYTQLQQKCNLRADLRAITDGGRNLLHMIVASSRPECFKVIFYSKMWEQLRLQMIDPSKDSQYGGYTPRGLAEKFLFKSKGPSTLEEYDHFDQLWLDMPLMHKACLYGHFSYVAVLADTCEDINVLDCSGAPCIHYACVSGATNVVNFLIDRGADPKIENSHGESGLTLAAMFGKTGAVKAVLSRFDFSSQTFDERKNRPIDYAAMNGDIEMVDTFSAGGIAPDERLVTLAAKYSRRPLLEKLVREYNLGVHGHDDNGRTPFLNAAARGRTDILQFLLDEENVADQSQSILLDRDKENHNCLHMVADAGHADACQFLIETATRRNQLDNILNSRDIYTGRERLMIVRGRDRGRKAWHYLSIKRALAHSFKKKMSSGQIDVKLFGDILSSGFGPNPSKKHLDDTEAELEATLKRRLVDMSPLVMAAYKDNADVACLLLDAGARTDLVDHFENTALHYVGMRGNLSLAQKLEQLGADVSAVNDEKKTPGDVAEDNEHIAVVNFVRGKELFKHAGNFKTCMEEKKGELSERTLASLRAEGKDIRRHLIATLRDLTIDINKVLLDLGSGPVQEESLDSQTQQDTGTSLSAFAGIRNEVVTSNTEPGSTTSRASASGGHSGSITKSPLETDSPLLPPCINGLLPA